ncbi:hypothetical protein [Helicobacter mustelae]|uniref:Putative membrane protein n=1 Tax=Helicobacter mustelae (strain ATCC 43772 / CCUG 25715 / CIP 103759 / LMG 18044 / NCTC 12198 / R85-136P) TaxID=679897 RepID=D3UG89_HELM1|nr:hypothetical protein [Helicobacter mustelae]CBG39510.1 Putative membrane protein [Helicobacter mustelae 12198]SQH71021.1 membrane protein [Helicobacter mustelae]STP12150.1 membrane protein [Helicobacter mustelae]
MEEKDPQKNWLSNLDSELVIKNMLFCLLFLCLVGMGVSYLLFPMIKKYKFTAEKQSRNHVVLEVTTKKFNDVQGAYMLFSRENKRLLDSLHREISTKDLKDFLERFFSQVSISKGEERSDEKTGFYEREFRAEVVAKNLQAIRDFFDGVKNASMNLRVLVPFVIKTKEDQLSVRFIIQSKRTIR